MAKRYAVDMTKGGIYSLIIKFTIPVLLTGVLQILFNAADMIVVGKFASEQALAAVGSTGSAINLFVSVFIGVSSATAVMVSNKYGADNKNGVHKVVHTSVAFALVCGAVTAILGLFFCDDMLRFMKCDKEVISQATLYMKIYLCGAPVMMLYNFCAAVLRAVGDTKRPLIFLSTAGIINVILNLILVIVFHLGVVGVAVATVTSQAVSAALACISLIKTNECFKLVIKKIRFYKTELIDLLKLGIPAGVQGSLFSISNIMIQSSINSVGTLAMAGNAASGSVEGLVYISLNSYYHSVLTFCGQNYGAGNMKRISKGLFASCVLSILTGLVIGGTVVIFARQLLGFYANVSEVISIGASRLKILAGTYFLCGLMEIGSAAQRALGASVIPMALSLLGACGLRLIMVHIGAPYNAAEDLMLLYYSYPISWFITMCMHLAAYKILRKKKEKELIGLGVIS